MGKLTALDFESYFDKDCTITKGLDNYLNHPDFDAYMISFYSEDGWAWCGHPKDAPWDRVAGDTLLAHNRNFDQPILELLQLKGEVPQFEHDGFHCTADMSAYHGWGRSLKESIKNAKGILMKKEIRDNMKGRKYEELPHEEKVAMAEYALFDSKACLVLAQEGLKDWPEHERELSMETTRMCRQGFPVDVDVLDQGVSQLSMVIEQSLEALPWTDVQKGALSAIQFGEYCRAKGVEPPKSLSKSDDATLSWMKANPAAAEVLVAMHDLRGANALLKKVETIKGRVRNGRVPYGMKYFGATPTGRDSGDSGFNVQNLPQADLYGVNLRSAIKAPEGKILAISDLSQIEPRCVAYMAGERELLRAASGGMDYYEAEARAMRMYDGPSPMADYAPDIRKAMKTNALGCQYMMGPDGLAKAAGISLESARVKVRKFRANRPKLMDLGKMLEREMRKSGRSGETFQLELPSGRVMDYHNVQLKGNLRADVLRNGKRMTLKYWKGILIENATQAFARDIFMDRVLALVKSGFNVILRVHDEVVIELDEAGAKEATAEIKHIMETPPDWCKTLPLHTDVFLTKHYTK